MAGKSFNMITLNIVINQGDRSLKLTENINELGTKALGSRWIRIFIEYHDGWYGAGATNLPPIGFELTEVFWFTVGAELTLLVL